MANEVKCKNGRNEHCVCMRLVNVGLLFFLAPKWLFQSCQVRVLVEMGNTTCLIVDTVEHKYHVLFKRP